MLRIGLTGGIASGKSTVADLLSREGVPIIDCDVLARELTQAGTQALQAIIEHFGKGLLKADGSLDRGALRRLIFTDPKQKQWLEELLHPLIRQEIHSRLAKLNAVYCVIVVPLLSEAKGVDYIDQIWVVDCPLEQQLKRLQERDHCSFDEAQRMLASQHSREQRLKIADAVIHNEGNFDTLRAQVLTLHQAAKQL